MSKKFEVGQTLWVADTWMGSPFDPRVVYVYTCNKGTTTEHSKIDNRRGAQAFLTEADAIRSKRMRAKLHDYFRLNEIGSLTDDQIERVLAIVDEAKRNPDNPKITT